MSSGAATALTSIGKTVKRIPVEISYRIIELFSAGLYSSPNKAIEELVSNSYDAMASVAHLVMPLDLAAHDATIWVADDGQSMDVDGLVELWRIARSRRREHPDETRPPIGKFGIGRSVFVSRTERVAREPLLRVWFIPVAHAPEVGLWVKLPD